VFRWSSQSPAPSPGPSSRSTALAASPPRPGARSAAPAASSSHAAAKGHPPDQRTPLERLLARAGQLPPLPHVAQKIMSLTRDMEHLHADTLTTVISTDQALTAQILKSANSAYFGLRRDVTNVRQACTLLGFARIRSMAMTFVADGVFTAAGRLGKQLWEHGVGAAVFARVLAEEVDRAEVEDAFIGGLLHDVGKILLLKADPDEFNFSMLESADDAAMRLESEREGFGVDHAQLGAYLGEKWGFPEKLVHAIARHHEPGPPRIQSKYEAVVALANLACHRFGVGCPGSEGINLFGTTLFRTLGLSDKQLHHCFEKFEEEYGKMLDLLSSGGQKL
jgi:putative nucleotidyltransferase with HDIG domain